MEARLVALEPIFGRDRARVSRTASELHAIRSGGASQMTGTGRDVIALEAEGADGARAEARLRRAGIAGTRAIDPLGQGEALGERERATVTVPEAPVRMDQHAERRAVRRLRSRRPALEGQPRRAFERIKRHGAELERQPTNDAARPAIERVRVALRSFWRRGESRPLAAPPEPRPYARAPRRAIRAR